MSAGLPNENPDNVDTQPVDLESAPVLPSPPKIQEFTNSDSATERSRYQNVKNQGLSETTEFPVAEPPAVPESGQEVPEPKHPDAPPKSVEEHKVLSHHKMIQDVFLMRCLLDKFKPIICTVHSG